MNFLLVNDAFPSFAFFNKVNCGRVDIGNDGKRVGWYAFTECPSYMDNLSLCKFMRWGFLSTKINKASSPLMLCVLRESNPFKILRAIVKFVSVDMVDGKAIFISWNKGHRNKPMDKNFWPDVTAFGRHNLIPTLGYPWLYLLSLQDACKCLLSIVSCPRCHCDGLRTKNSCVRKHKPVNAFFSDFYGRHAVNDTAGH